MTIPAAEASQISLSSPGWRWMWTAAKFVSKMEKNPGENPVFYCFLQVSYNCKAAAGET